MFKTSNLLFIITIILFSMFIISYKLLYKNLNNNHQYSQKITFSNIQRETDILLNKLLFKYSMQKEILHQKHKQVLKYLETHSYDAPLDEIFLQINEDTQNNPYNIYITDKDLIIRNTTFTPDLNFNLNFAKDLFDYHKKEKIIGVSAPIFETFSMNFMSFSDSYLPKDEGKRILQVSYRYDNVYDELEEIKKLIDSDRNIFNSTAYIIFSDGYIGDFIFKSIKSYKPTLDEINERINKGRDLLTKLSEKDFIITDFTKDNTKYKLFYFLQKSPIFNDAKIIYSVIFDETEFKQDLLYLDLITALVFIIALMVIVIIYKIKMKENLLSYKDKFIEHSVHEIKTPLSVIKLNNQLREKKFGEDKYTKKIEAAIKTLQNSYDDMTFLHTNEKIHYEIENVDLALHLKHRVNFFESIATSQSKKIIYKIKNSCFLDISKIELDRLIDNNLSNAIKYSHLSTNIEVILEKNTLKFISKGNKIINTEDIFEKYTRENNIQGGHGLGLSIVKNICKKYNISIKVKSFNGINIFVYKFNCHA